MVLESILIKLQTFKLSHLGKFLAVYGMEFM